jgi:hypothetical protein
VCTLHRNYKLWNFLLEIYEERRTLEPNGKDSNAERRGRIISSSPLRQTPRARSVQAAETLSSGSRTHCKRHTRASTVTGHPSACNYFRNRESSPRRGFRMAGDGALPFAGSSALKAREAWGNGSRKYRSDDVTETARGAGREVHCQ